MVVIFASLSIIISPSAQGPLVQAELGSAFVYRKNSSFLISHYCYYAYFSWHAQTEWYAYIT